MSKRVWGEKIYLDFDWPPLMSDDDVVQAFVRRFGLPSTFTLAQRLKKQHSVDGVEWLRFHPDHPIYKQLPTEQPVAGLSLPEVAPWEDEVPSANGPLCLSDPTTTVNITAPKAVPSPAPVDAPEGEDAAETMAFDAPDPIDAPAHTAVLILAAAATHIADRADIYDKDGGDGARSMGAAVAAFNVIHGAKMTEAQGWHLLQLLKDVRLFTAPAYHPDSAEDCIGYAALKAEALANAGAVQ